MKTVKINEAFGVGWNKFMARPWYLFGFTLGMFVLFLASSASDAFFTALAYIVYGGYLAVLIRHFNGEKISFDDLFSLDSRWISFAFLGVIKSLLIMLGFVFFIIPGIYLSIKWMFAELLVIDQGMKPMEALRASSAMTEGHRWKLLLFSFASSLVILAGLFLLVVGSVAAGILVGFATIKIYFDLKNA